MARRIYDLADMPDFNWATQKDRADWSTRDVSARTVVLNPEWNKPDCVEHGAMTACHPPGTSTGAWHVAAQPTCRGTKLTAPRTGGGPDGKESSR